MIRVKIIKENGIINNINIIGHADYDVCGKDIVCAATSSIVITTINAILKIDESSISYKDNLNITILKHSEVIDILIDNMISMLQELEKDYKKYIKVEI